MCNLSVFHLLNFIKNSIICFALSYMFIEKRYYFPFQDAILTTMDIIYEGFGFMLSFGDLAWVPFLYTLQGRYLLEHPAPMPWYCLAAIVFLNGKLIKVDKPLPGDLCIFQIFNF